MVLINNKFAYIIDEGHNNDQNKGIILAIEKHTKLTIEGMNDWRKEKELENPMVDKDYNWEDDLNVSEVKAFWAIG